MFDSRRRTIGQSDTSNFRHHVHRHLKSSATTVRIHNNLSAFASRLRWRWNTRNQNVLLVQDAEESVPQLELHAQERPPGH